jgi:hypothetical protein
MWVPRDVLGNQRRWRRLLFAPGPLGHERRVVSRSIGLLSAWGERGRPMLWPGGGTLAHPAIRALMNRSADGS